VKFSQRIKPVSYLKAHTARIIRELSTQPGILVITQDGRAKAVVQDIDSYEQTQESLAMLKLLTQSQRSIEAGKHKPLKKAFADLSVRTKKVPRNARCSWLRRPRTDIFDIYRYVLRADGRMVVAIPSRALFHSNLVGSSSRAPWWTVRISAASPRRR